MVQYSRHDSDEITSALEPFLKAFEKPNLRRYTVLTHFIKGEQFYSFDSFFLKLLP